ncbi:MAG TPA: MFS transporter, partial [Actinotalea sp.]|nr:MFS transporter [Actinotalea sp.]
PLVAQFTAVAGLSLVWRLRSIPHAVLPEPSAGLPEPRAGLPEPSAPGPGGGSRPADPAARRRTGGLRQSLHAWQDRRTLAMGLVIMAGALSEGTANTWVAIGVVDGFAVREAFGAVVFAAFVAGMTAARLAGTWLIDRHGSRRVLTVSAAASIGGLVGFSFSPSVPVALAAAAVWGLGSGLVVPIGMAAVTGDGVGAAGRGAVVSAFASVANLVAPPVTGLLAERVGVRHAVLAAVVVLAAGLVVGRRILQESPGGGPMRED